MLLGRGCHQRLVPIGEQAPRAGPVQTSSVSLRSQMICLLRGSNEGSTPEM
jgi:hypothetical protein